MTAEGAAAVARAWAQSIAKARGNGKQLDLPTPAPSLPADSATRSETANFDWTETADTNASSAPTSPRRGKLINPRMQGSSKRPNSATAHTASSRRRTVGFDVDAEAESPAHSRPRMSVANLMVMEGRQELTFRPATNQVSEVLNAIQQPEPRPRWQQLYETHLDSEGKADREIASARKKLQAELQHCTFKPVVNRGAVSAPKDDRPIHERAAQWAQQAQARVEQLRKQREKDELAHCTPGPKFTPRARTPRARPAQSHRGELAFVERQRYARILREQRDARLRTDASQR